MLREGFRDECFYICVRALVLLRLYPGYIYMYIYICMYTFKRDKEVGGVIAGYDTMIFFDLYVLERWIFLVVFIL